MNDNILLMNGMFQPGIPTKELPSLLVHPWYIKPTNGMCYSMIAAKLILVVLLKVDSLPVGVNTPSVGKTISRQCLTAFHDNKEFVRVIVKAYLVSIDYTAYVPYVDRWLP
jgi:hypothetical protein